MNPSRSLNLLSGARLSFMMLLQFFVWGAWYVTAPRVLGRVGFDGGDFGWLYSVGPIAGMISPFFVGMIADRFFSTERVLAAMHILAAAAMLLAIQLIQAEQPDPALINLAFFLHMLCYFPTLALTNSLALHNVSDSEKQFPLIRVFGTIGWILGNWTLSVMGWGTSIEMFYLAAGSGFLLGIYSLTLPHTPPPSKGTKTTIREVLGLDALTLLEKRAFLIFMVSSFLICIPLAFYYQLAERTVGAAGIEDAPFVMGFGQVSEIFFMLIMPLFFVRLGVKWMLAVGMLAWVVRYALFSIGAPDQISWMIIAGVLLHGICYDFFFVTGQIYTDKVAPSRIRSQAQGMLVFFTLGLGMFIGAQVAGRVEDTWRDHEQAAVIQQQIGEQKTEIQALQAILDSGRKVAGTAAKLEAAQDNLTKLGVDDLRAYDWETIWRIPAIAAFIVLLLFIFIFPRNPESAHDTKSPDDPGE